MIRLFLATSVALLTEASCPVVSLQPAAVLVAVPRFDESSDQLGCFRVVTPGVFGWRDFLMVTRSLSRLCLSVLVCSCFILEGAAIDNALGRTPPMGWRSWNCYHGKMQAVIVYKMT